MDRYFVICGFSKEGPSYEGFYPSREEAKKDMKILSEVYDWVQIVDLEVQTDYFGD